MGKILTYLGISEEGQGKDVLDAERLLEGMQNIYANTPEGEKKDAFAIPLAEMTRLFIQKVKKTEVPKEEKPKEEEKHEEKENEKDDFPYKVGDKFEQDNGNEFYIWTIEKIKNAKEVVMSMRGDVGLLPKLLVPKKDVIDNVKAGLWIPIKEDIPQMPEKPSKPQKPQKPKPSKPTASTPPQPPVPPEIEQMTCEEIKEAILGLNLLAKMGDDEAKTTIKQLKNQLKTQNCK